MNSDSLSEMAVFPRAGVAARRWGRFERDYRAWLETAAGRFSVWRAVQVLEPGVVAKPDAIAVDHRPRTDGS